MTELTNNSGSIQAEYLYDCYGRVTKFPGSLVPDFQYAGYYFHTPSNLNLAFHRFYSANIGRWINRDLIGESGGINIYAYVENNPINRLDPTGDSYSDLGPGSGINGPHNHTLPFPGFYCTPRLPSWKHWNNFPSWPPLGLPYDDKDKGIPPGFPGNETPLPPPPNLPNPPTNFNGMPYIPAPIPNWPVYSIA